MHDAHGIVIATIARFDALDVFFQVELQMDFPGILAQANHVFRIEEAIGRRQQPSRAAGIQTFIALLVQPEVGHAPFGDVMPLGLQIGQIILGAIRVAIMELSQQIFGKRKHVRRPDLIRFDQLRTAQIGRHMDV